jgi:hypothetical protein
MASFPEQDDATNLAKLITRHQEGDYGETCEEDKQLNIEALEQGLRVVSKYSYKDKELFVITEADRSATTMMLTEEY